MTNAKEEMLALLKGKEIKCAEITNGDEWSDQEQNVAILLKVGYTDADLKEFLGYLDFNYDSGYGGQRLFGTVWFKNNIWAERGEYDGSEWWEIRSIPGIPKELLPLLVADSSEPLIIQ